MRDDPEFDPYNNLHSVTHNGSQYEIGDGILLNAQDVWRAAIAANAVWSKMQEVSVAGTALLDIMDQKVISGLVGEFFRAELAAECSYLFSNPRDDGHPDLCVISERTTKFLSENGIHLPNTRTNLSKGIWTPYGGESNRLPGVEIKATIIGGPVEDVRGPRYLNAKKPSWSAHHQHIPILLGIVWDYVERLPTIVGAFFANSLDTTIGKDNPHWSSVSIPKDGSKGTSSCSLLLEGCKVMYKTPVLTSVNDNIKHLLSIRTKAIIPLSELTKDEIQDILSQNGIKMSKNNTKSVLIEELLNHRYNSLLDAIQSEEEEFDLSDRIIELLNQIGDLDFAPTDNLSKNWIKLEHYFSNERSNVEDLQIKTVSVLLRPNPVDFFQSLRDTLKLKQH